MQIENGVYPKFMIEPRQNKRKSQEEGRPIFDDVEMVEIHIAGDTKSVTVQKVTDKHRNRWPQHYQAFKNHQETPISGTPLDQWPSLTASKIMELKSLKIHTLEDLAGLNENAIGRLGMGGRDLVKRANDFIELAKGSAPLERLSNELEEKEKEIQALNARLDELHSMISADPEVKPRKPGRPKGS